MEGGQKRLQKGSDVELSLECGEAGTSQYQAWGVSNPTQTHTQTFCGGFSVLKCIGREGRLLGKLYVFDFIADLGGVRAGLLPTASSGLSTVQLAVICTPQQPRPVSPLEPCMGVGDGPRSVHRTWHRTHFLSSLGVAGARSREPSCGLWSSRCPALWKQPRLGRSSRCL